LHILGVVESIVRSETTPQKIFKQCGPDLNENLGGSCRRIFGLIARIGGFMYPVATKRKSEK